MSRTSEKQAIRELPVVPLGAPRLRLTGATGDRPVQCESAQPVTLIGARRDCDLPLAHPEVSKIHCAIVNTGRSLIVCDLSSRAGTFVNETPVRVSPFGPGDALRIGPVAVQIDFIGGAQATGDADSARLQPPLRLRLGDATILVRDGVAVIGRRNTCDIVLDTPDVSLAHALVFALDGRPALCDLGSRSGSILNGRRTALTWLEDGDRLEIGGEALTVERESPPPTVRTRPAADVRAGDDAGEGPADAAPELVGELPTSGDLADLERGVAALHAQIASSRAKLAERSAELQARSEELDGWRQEVTQAEEELRERASNLQAAEEAARSKLAEALEAEKSLRARRGELAQLQSTLSEQHAESDALAAKLEQQQSELSAQAQELGQKRAALAEQEQVLNAARETLEKQKDALAEREAALRTAAEELACDRAQLGAAQTDLSQRETRLAETARTLEQREARHVEAAQELEQRLAQCAEREVALDRRADEVQRHQAAIRQREKVDKEAVRRIDEFRRAIQQATQMLADAPAGSGQAAHTPSSSAPAPDQPPPATDTSAASGNTDEAEGARTASVEELPAPVVDQPLFGGQTVPLPTDWPAELRERFRVLRRMSKKSDADLIAQVLAEHEAGALTAVVTATRAKEKLRERRSGRGWLRIRRDAGS